ncbi:MAG: 50S ribosomal protein L32 [Patescibacteria group bacterium]
MALPTQKRSKSRKRVRQYQYRLSKFSLSKCPQCGKPILPHRACLFCGFYAGREVIKSRITKEKKTKTDKKQ